VLKIWEINVINERNDSAGVLTIVMKYCVSSVAPLLSSVPYGLRHCSSKFWFSFATEYVCLYVYVNWINKNILWIRTFNYKTEQCLRQIWIFNTVNDFKCSKTISLSLICGLVGTRYTVLIWSHGIFAHWYETVVRRD
jgi:hypothetical protein